MTDAVTELDSQPRPKSRRTLYITVAVVLVIAVTAGAVWAVPRIFGGDITVAGELVLTGDGIEFGTTTGECVGGASYNDVHEGTQIVISDAASTTIAVGSLGEGKPDAWAGTSWTKPRYCAFPFTVSVPSGHDFYGFTIGKRGTMRYSADDLAKPLRLTLS